MPGTLTSDEMEFDVLVLGAGGILGEAWMGGVLVGAGGIRGGAGGGGGLGGMGGARGSAPRRGEPFVGPPAGSLGAGARGGGTDPRPRLEHLPEQPAARPARDSSRGGMVGS